MDNGHLCNLRVDDLCRCPIQFQPVRKETLDYYTLRDSIRQLGIISPLLVRLVDGQYEVVCGNHRLECAIDLKMEFVPCMVVDISDEEVPDIQFQENKHRVTPRTVDYVRHLQRMVHLGEDSVLGIAARLHCHPDWVEGLLSLNRLCPEAKKYLDLGALPLEVGMELAKLSLPQQEELLDLIGDLTETEALELVRRVVRDIRRQRFVERRSDDEVRPRYRFWRTVLDEYLEPTQAASVLARAEAETPLEVWKACIEWIIQMDEYTFSERKARKERDKKLKKHRQDRRTLELKERTDEQ